MKKNIIFLMIALAGFMFVGVQSANAQASYSVTFGWNDVACECGIPVDKYVRIELWTLENPPVKADETIWEITDSNPYTVQSSVEDGLEDCQTDCYLVKAFVEYRVGLAPCCEGSAQETFTGSELANGATFTLTIPLF